MLRGYGEGIAEIQEGSRRSRHPRPGKRRVELEVKNTLPDQLFGAFTVAGLQLVALGHFGDERRVDRMDNYRAIAPGREKPGPARRIGFDLELNTEVTIAKSTNVLPHRIHILFGGTDSFGQCHLLFESCIQPVIESGIQRVHRAGVALEYDASYRLHIDLETRRPVCRLIVAGRLDVRSGHRGDVRHRQQKHYRCHEPKHAVPPLKRSEILTCWCGFERVDALRSRNDRLGHAQVQQGHPEHVSALKFGEQVHGCATGSGSAKGSSSTPNSARRAA